MPDTKLTKNTVSFQDLSLIDQFLLEELEDESSEIHAMTNALITETILLSANEKELENLRNLFKVNEQQFTDEVVKLIPKYQTKINKRLTKAFTDLKNAS